MNNTITVRSGAWYGDKALTLNFPTNWEVEMLGPKDAPALSDAQIEQAFAEPIGTPRISELAKGKKSAAIVVDDLSRPTPAARVIPFLLRELAAAGVAKVRNPICCWPRFPSSLDRCRDPYKGWGRCGCGV